jgi:hypothetical protein
MLVAPRAFVTVHQATVFLEQAGTDVMILQ